MVRGVSSVSPWAPVSPRARGPVGPRARGPVDGPVVGPVGGPAGPWRARGTLADASQDSAEVKNLDPELVVRISG